MNSRYLAFADRRLLLNFPAALDSVIDFLFVHVRPGRDRPPDHTFTLRQESSGACVLEKDGKKIGTTPNGTAMANLLMGEVIYAMIDGVHSGLTLHAAAVSRGNKGIWMPGTSGAGKSSLSAWLATRGFTYLTDELIHCPFGGLFFEAFSRPLNFKNHGLAAIATLLPTNTLKNDKLADEAVTMVQSDVFGKNEPASPSELSLLLFPAFKQGTDLRIEPLSPAQAGLELMGCHVNARNLPGHGFSVVVDLCRQVPACRLTYGSFDQLPGALDTFLDLALDCAFSAAQFKKLTTLISGSSKNHASSTDKGRKKIPAPTPVHARKKMTIGMATYDDYDGVYFTVQATGLYHPEVTDDIEIIVLDNHPDGPESKSLKRLEKRGNYRYIPYTEKTGTAIRNRIFLEANSDYVLCIDSHVLIAPGAIARLIDYLDKRPQCMDLLQGPLLHDDLKTMDTHFKPLWKQGMYGVWDSDPRAGDGNCQPFDIPMQGLGLFACRKEAWPGFNPDFRGFGGEEGYIHEKFRQLGRRTLCLPFLRWLHRFDRPSGVPYTVNWQDRKWNYMIGFKELGLDTDVIIQHFNDHLGEQATTDILHQLNLIDDTQ